MSNSGRRLPGWVLPVGLGVLIIALVTIALLRDPVELDPDSPEGAVQEYLTAINEGRWQDAIEVVHEDWRGECGDADLSSFADEDFTAELGEQVRVEEAARFRNVGSPEGPLPAVPGDATRVVVTINRDGGRSLGSGWSEEVVFTLVDDGEFWWLVGDPWPYFLWSCREGR